MATTIRQQRVAELLFEELSILIGSELDDPQLSLIQVTNVVISRDLRHAKVFVSHDEDEVTKKAVLRGLKRATPYLRHEIATRCTMRAVPELLFYYDDTPERAARIDAILRQIAAEREPVDADESGATDSSPAADVV